MSTTRKYVCRVKEAVYVEYTYEAQNLAEAMLKHEEGEALKVSPDLGAAHQIGADLWQFDAEEEAKN